MRPLLDVYVDAGCEVVEESALRQLAARRLDALRDAGRLKDGGILLFGARTSDGAPSLAGLRALRRENRHVLAFACVRTDSHVHRDLARYTLAGLDQLFILESPADLSDLVRTVTERALTPPPLRALQTLPELGLERLPMCVVEHAFRNSPGASSLIDVAQRFRRSLRTIEHWCDAAAMPAVSELFRLGRYLHITQLETQFTISATERASRLGFQTATNMRQWIWRLRRSVLANQRLREFVPRFEDLCALLLGE